MLGGPEEYSKCKVCNASMPAYVAVIRRECAPASAAPEPRRPPATADVGTDSVEEGLLG